MIICMSGSMIKADSNEWFDEQENTYRCPITRESAEWHRAENGWERKQLLQVPGDLLHLIPTDNLLEIVLDYYYLGDIMYYDSFGDAIMCMQDQYNAIGELLDRGDLGEVLLDSYLEMEFENSLDSYARATFVENFLATDDIFASLSLNQRNALVSDASQKVFEKVGKMFFNNTRTDFLDQITKLNLMLINGVGSGNGDQINTTAIQIVTPGGSYITLYKWTSSDVDFTSAEKQALDAQTASNYPGIVQLETSTKKYNCHYYAMIYRSNYSGFSGYKSKIYQFKSPYTMIYDGSYTHLNITKPTAVSQLVIYSSSSTVSATSIKHSARVHTVNSTEYTSKYTSKFGNGPLVVHTLANCPYYSSASHISFYN